MGCSDPQKKKQCESNCKDTNKECKTVEKQCKCIPKKISKTRTKYRILYEQYLNYNQK